MKHFLQLSLKRFLELLVGRAWKDTSTAVFNRTSVSYIICCTACLSRINIVPLISSLLGVADHSSIFNDLTYKAVNIGKQIPSLAIPLCKCNNVTCNNELVLLFFSWMFKLFSLFPIRDTGNSLTAIESHRNINIPILFNLTALTNNEAVAAAVQTSLDWGQMHDGGLSCNWPCLLLFSAPAWLSSDYSCILAQ